MKHNKTLLAAIPLCFAPSCLTGCTGKGNRVITIEGMGQTIVIKDEVPVNDEGKQEYSRDFTPFGQSVVDLLFGSLFGDDGDGGDQAENPEP